MVEKNWIDRSLIEQNELEGIIKKLLVHADPQIQYHSAFLFLLIMDNEFVNKESIIYLKLIEMISWRSKHTDPKTMKIPLFKTIKAEFMQAVDHTLFETISTGNLHRLSEDSYILSQLANNKLIDKSFIKTLIKETKLDKLFSETNPEANTNILNFFYLLNYFDLTDLSLITDFQLIEKFMECTYSVIPEIWPRNLYMDWIDRHPEIKHILIYKLNQIAIKQVENHDSEVKRTISKTLYSLLSNGYIDKNLLLESELTQKIVQHLLTNSDPIEDDGYWEIAESSALMFLGNLVEKGWLEKSTFENLKIAEKCFTELKFDNPLSGEESSPEWKIGINRIRPFFESLVENSLITQEDLIRKSVELLDSQELRTKENIIEFLSWFYIDPLDAKITDQLEDEMDYTKWPPIDQSLIKELDLLQKLTNILPFAEYGSELGKKLYNLIRDLSKIK